MLDHSCRNCGGSMAGKRSNAVFCKRTCKESYKQKIERGTVEPGDEIVKAPSLPLSGVVDAVCRGSELDTLIAMRLKIAEAIDDCRRPADLPPLTKRLQELSSEIEALQLEKNKTQPVRSVSDEAKPRPVILKAI